MGDVVYVYVYKTKLFYTDEFNLLNPKPKLPVQGKDGTDFGALELTPNSTCDGHTSIVVIDIDNNDLYIKRCCENFGLKNKNNSTLLLSNDTRDKN